MATPVAVVARIFLLADTRYTVGIAGTSVSVERLSVFSGCRSRVGFLLTRVAEIRRSARAAKYPPLWSFAGAIIRAYKTADW